MPGFHKDNPPFGGVISIKRFSHYFDQRIADLDVDEYVVGGVSFGFLVVNEARLDKRCRAILAMEPFLNVDCLNLPFLTREKYIIIATLLKLMRTFGMEQKVWSSNWFNRYLRDELGYPKERLDTIIDNLDAHTFFSVTRLLLTYHKKPVFHDLPHFLIGNFSDKTMNFDMTAEIFLKNLRELHIASEPIDHYPKDLTKAYFETRIPKEHVYRMIECMGEKS